MENQKSVVLVVEDNKTIAKLIQSYLEKTNYSVITADNGLKAIEVLDKLKPGDLPHCITMAIMMSKMDGLEACQKIKNDKRFKDIPVIILTAQSDIQNQIKAVKYGAYDFLSKPIEPELLLNKVENCVKFTQVIRENHRLNEVIEGYKIARNLPYASIGGVDDDDDDEFEEIT